VEARTRARVAQVAAIVGVGALTVGSVVTAIVYTGSAGEPYSPLNHWVSELGELSVSRAAPLFNAGLVVGGLCFAVFVAGLAASVPGRSRFAWAVTGVIAGVAGALVGLFPMDDLRPHSVAALTFFCLGWLTVALASIDLARRRDPRFPRWLGGIGALATGFFVLFMASLFADTRTTGEVLAAPDARPDVWAASVLEWAVVLSIATWALATALAWMTADRRALAARDGVDGGLRPGTARA
jgi:hypothetical membrane protein